MFNVVASPHLLDVSWAKGKSDCYYLNSAGNMFCGYMYPAGKALKQASPGSPESDCMTFIPCRNRGKPRLVPCALSTRKFKYCKESTEIVCKLGLMLGLSYHPETRMIYFNYLDWNNNKSGYVSLCEAMHALQNPMDFVRVMFDHEVVVACVNSNPGTGADMRQYFEEASLVASARREFLNSYQVGHRFENVCFLATTISKKLSMKLGKSLRLID